MEDEIASIAKTIAENYFDDELQNVFYDVLLQMYVMVFGFNEMMIDRI